MRLYSTTSGNFRRPARAVSRRLTLLGVLGPWALAATLALAGMAPDGARAAEPPTLIKGHKVLSVACVPGPANTVRAQVRVRMYVVNYDNWRDWAEYMEAKTRLEPTTAGLNYPRSWRKWKSPYLAQNKRHRYDISLTTDNVSANADWRVHLKLVWRRPGPIKNISKDVYLNFNGSCARWAPAEA